MDTAPTLLCMLLPQHTAGSGADRLCERTSAGFQTAVHALHRMSTCTYSLQSCKTGLLQACAPVEPAAQVRGLEFNGLSPNLLASGGSDGELCIWDVAVPSAPNLYPGLKARAHV